MRQRRSAARSAEAEATQAREVAAAEAAAALPPVVAAPAVTSQRVMIGVTTFTLYSDGTIATRKRSRSRLIVVRVQDNSLRKAWTQVKPGGKFFTDGGVLHLVVITDDWEMTKSYAAPTLIERRAVAKLEAFGLRNNCLGR